MAALPIQSCLYLRQLGLILIFSEMAKRGVTYDGDVLSRPRSYVIWIGGSSLVAKLVTSDR